MPADPLRQKQLFDQALARPLEERAAFLDDACGADGDLRVRVDALLASLAAASDFLADPAPAAGGSNEKPGGVIDRYRLLQRIGEGGFGTVWMAEQQEPVRRNVALKVIKLGMDTRQVVARFEAERQALALMEHPNIAKVFDGGVTPGGRPYFVMELIKGVPITEYCDQAELSTQRRLELFQQVCYAVQHAHQKGVIHRDLKPSNILVTLHDGAPVPKVIDFGIAKATSAELTQKTMFTEFRQMVGTPEYMAPEQAELSGFDVDTRADVYSLGVVLYEMLTGTKPFDVKELLEKGYLEMLRVIREDQPPKPSTRISTMGQQLAAVARNRHATPRALHQVIHGDLDWIVMKAIEKDRFRRYPTANDLAVDIGRHLRDLPVQAGPPGAGYRLRKFVRRNRVVVIAGGSVLAALVLGLAGTIDGIVRARDQATQASEQADRANVVLDFVAEILKSSDPRVAGGRQEMTVLDAMQKAVEDIDSGRFAGHPATEASLLSTIGLILLGNGKADDAELLLSRALKARERLHPGGHPDVANTLVALGMTLHQRGHTLDAESLLRRALAMNKRFHPGDHDDVAINLEHLGIVVQALDRADEAEPLFQSALEMNERLHEGDHEAVASILLGLGLARAARGHLADAEDPLVRALAMNQRLHPDEDNPDVADALGGLAEVRLALRGPAAAEPLYRKALEMNQNMYQGDHPRVASNLGNLGCVLDNLGRLADAERLLTQALEMNERLHGGEDHPDVARSLNNLAMVVQKRSPADAEPLYERALSIHQSLYPYDHSAVAGSLLGLAMVKIYQGRVADAEPQLAESLAMNQRLHPGMDHPDVALGLCNLARVHQLLGRPADARAGYDEGIAMLRRLAPEGTTLLAQALCNSGSAHLEDGDAETALPELEQAEAMATRLLPEGDPMVAQCRATLATCRERLPK